MMLIVRQMPDCKSLEWQHRLHGNPNLTIPSSFNCTRQLYQHLYQHLWILFAWTAVRNLMREM